MKLTCVVLLILITFTQTLFPAAEEDIALQERRKQAKLVRASQREALIEWVQTLTVKDLDPAYWSTVESWKAQPQNYFDHYVTVLSDIFAKKQPPATINFILVGACDGSHDKTISEHYLPNKHWRGAFVEPFEMNYNDLTKFMKEV